MCFQFEKSRLRWIPHKKGLVILSFDVFILILYRLKKRSTYRWCHTISLRPRHICSAVHYRSVVTNTMLSQITSVSIANSAVCSGADQSKHQRSASLALVRWIHRSAMNSPHKGLITQKIFSIWWLHEIQYPRIVTKSLPFKSYDNGGKATEVDQR